MSAPENVMPCPDGHKTVTVAQWPNGEGEWRYYGFCTCCGWRGPAASNAAMVGELVEAGNEMHRRLMGFVCALAEMTDCGPDVDAATSWERARAKASEVQP